MKKILAFLLLLTFLANLSAQSGVKKYVLIEHFTNSRCPTCASRNPAFYDFINQSQYASEVHHIAFHPQFPYPQCVFYQANTVENSARASFYGINGTPQIVLNGSYIGGGNPLITATKINPFLNQTSPLYLKVTETGTGTARSVQIKARTVVPFPANNTYKIYAAIVEKDIFQTTPNGEDEHHDVFRKMIPSLNGVPFTPAIVGSELTLTADYQIESGWGADEIYVLVWVQSVETKEIVNSGTKFDPSVTPVVTAEFKSLEFRPNPAGDVVFAELGNEQFRNVEAYNSSGQRVSIYADVQAGNRLMLRTTNLKSGLYFIKVTGARSVYVAKLLK
jgi:hypothetical protein